MQPFGTAWRPARHDLGVAQLRMPKVSARELAFEAVTCPFLSEAGVVARLRILASDEKGHVTASNESSRAGTLGIQSCAAPRSWRAGRQALLWLLAPCSGSGSGWLCVWLGLLRFLSGEGCGFSRKRGFHAPRYRASVVWLPRHLSLQCLISPPHMSG